MTKSLYQFGSTLLHHGNFLNELLFEISVFLFCFSLQRKSKSARELEISQAKRGPKKNVYPFGGDSVCAIS